jgi:hypothetical protein
VQLQAARHLADYHPTEGFASSGAVALIDEASAAMDSFDRPSAAERADVLALLLLKIRD